MMFLGAVAQLGEHHVRNVGVVGSNPICSTMYHSQQLAIDIARVHGAAMYHMQSQRVVIHALYLKNAEGILNGIGP